MEVIGLSLFLFGGATAFCLLVGVLIGICGLGGILIIPFLVYVAGYDISIVIPACMAGFIVGALSASYAYGKRGSIHWQKALYLALGAAPGAYLGSITVVILAPLILEVIVASLVALSGVNALRPSGRQNSQNGVETVPDVALVMLGLAVGYGSSVSGTGGPLLLIPSLLLLRYPVRTAVGLSMAIQLPIAPFATLGHLVHGSIEWILALPVAVGLGFGVILGARIAHQISTQVVERVVAISLLASAVLIVMRLIL